jgi:hypothetical protein
MADLFVAVGTVKGKQRRVGLRVGGVAGNFDVDAMKRHFSKHPYPVKFDNPSKVEIIEVGNENADPDAPRIPLHKVVRDPKKLTEMINNANKEIVSEKGGSAQPAENLEIKEPTVTETTNNTAVSDSPEAKAVAEANAIPEEGNSAK